MKKLSKQRGALFIALVSITNLERFSYLQSMRMKNKVGLFDFTMIVVSLVIGMGIFRTPVNVAAASPTPMIFFYAVNMLGLRLSAKTQTVLTIIKIALILLLITPIFFASGNNDPSSIIQSSISPGFREYIKAFGVGLVAVSFTYGGYQQTIN